MEVRRRLRVAKAFACVAGMFICDFDRTGCPFLLVQSFDVAQEGRCNRRNDQSSGDRLFARAPLHGPAVTTAALVVDIPAQMPTGWIRLLGFIVLLRHSLFLFSVTPSKPAPSKVEGPRGPFNAPTPASIHHAVDQPGAEALSWHCHTEPVEVSH